MLIVSMKLFFYVKKKSVPAIYSLLINEMYKKRSTTNAMLLRMIYVMILFVDDQFRIKAVFNLYHVESARSEHMQHYMIIS